MEFKDSLIRLGSDILDVRKDIAELGLLCSKSCREIYKFSKKRYRLLLAAGIVYILVAENKRIEMDTKIETLAKEVEELKDMKGD